MIFSKNLYIVDDLKWSFIDAILKKRIKEAIFWITEYYSSGYKKESWELVWNTYCSFYFTENSFYNKNILQLYSKWLIKEDFIYILEIVYRLFKFKKMNMDFFKIIWKTLKYKTKSIEISTKLQKKLNLSKNNLFNELVKSLIEKDYKSIWFFLQYNNEVSLQIVKKYYNNSCICIKYTQQFDKQMQLMMFIWTTNKTKKKRKNFKIKVNKELMKFYEKITIKKEIEPYKLLKTTRKYEVPNEIGCFVLERNNYNLDEIKEMYFYKWLYYCKDCPYWKEIIEKWCIEFDENKEPIFMNDELLEKFYSKFGLEPDEQTIETHNKSIRKIENYEMNKWINSFN
jgi:hypothetical protein